MRRRLRIADCRLRILMLMIVVCQAFGQTQEKSDQKKVDIFDLMQTEKLSSTAVAPTAGIALESTVDPEKYYVGPSDVIAVSIWISPPQNYPLTVTPEGTLIIPTVGEVMVSDMTLAKAKVKIFDEVRKKYVSPNISVTLLKPRPIIVSVVGAVLNPGLFTVTAVDRANKAIDEANKPSRLQDPEDVKRVLDVMSMRNIAVKHKDGTQDRADLQKYFGTREDKWNPYLREGDIIIIPKKDPFKHVFAVYGQTNSNGRFEYVEGDSLLDAVKIANGLTSRALPEEVIFSRMSDDGTSLSNHTINLAAIIAGREPNFPLQPGDRIIVKAKADVRGDYNVDVHGEVMYPGTYPITRNATRLSDIIKQAGGFTEYAALENAHLMRQTFLPENPDDIQKEEMLSMRGMASTGDTIGYGVETNLRIHQEGVVVDFRKLFVDKDSSQDIVLQREDQIIVPTRQQTVYVFGQVTSPGHVPFIEGKEAKYYIEKAGGFTGRASKGDVKIIKAKTKQWLDPGDTKLEQGDNIWVPAAADHPFSYYMTIASQAASVLGVVIGIAVLVVQATK